MLFFIIITERGRKLKNKFYLHLSVGWWLKTAKRKKDNTLGYYCIFYMLFSVVIFVISAENI